MMQRRRRYAIVGLGARHYLFRDAIVSQFTETSELVAVCDNNPGRVALAVREVEGATGRPLAGYDHTAFADMINDTRPDVVIVTTRDNTHDDYICQAMMLGCDVISEKPMTTDEVKCRRILETQRRTGRRLTVTFNYRYAPARTQVKELLVAGAIGEVLSVDFHWLLDTHHGADYFRRWHRNKVNSGGLMVHKATHHFDLVNWWLSTIPERVVASGARRFYRPETGDRFGLVPRGDRCHGCPAGSRCPFLLDLAAVPDLKQLYLDNERYDGYCRDRCVFSAEIDIEDGMSLVVDYASGATLSYSLTAFSPWEGYTIAFNGTKGRLEHKMEESTYISGDGTVPGALKPEGTWIRLFPHWGTARQIEIRQGAGGHGGADPAMLAYLFDPDGQPADPLLRAADQRAGAWSILTGVAANRSMAEQRSVTIAELLPDVEWPAYPAMPADDEPLAAASATSARRVT